MLFEFYSQRDCKNIATLLSFIWKKALQTKSINKIKPHKIYLETLWGLDEFRVMKVFWVCRNLSYGISKLIISLFFSQHYRRYQSYTS